MLTGKAPWVSAAALPRVGHCNGTSGGDFGSVFFDSTSIGLSVSSEDVLRAGLNSCCRSGTVSTGSGAFALGAMAADCAPAPCSTATVCVPAVCVPATANIGGGHAHAEALAPVNANGRDCAGSRSALAKLSAQCSRSGFIEYQQIPVTEGHVPCVLTRGHGVTHFLGTG